MKRYKTGMFGGKFMPLHKGHEYCVECAARECETVYVILFFGGEEEERILERQPEGWLSPEARRKQLRKLCRKYEGRANVIPAEIDRGRLREICGNDTWDAETPLVREITGGRVDAVYTSEVAYAGYFRRSYPEADLRLVDVKRKKYPVSGTLLRAMKKEEREKWMV